MPTPTHPRAPSAQARLDSFPRKPLVGAGALILFTLGLAIFGRATGVGAPQPTGVATAQRTLTFADRPDGAVIVRIAGSDQVLDIMTGQQGFLRGSLRGFARIRHMDGIGSALPLVLTGYADGRLVLRDPSTGRTQELEAFGSANEAVFVHLLTMAPQSQTTSAAPATPTQGGI
jgi:putative photosynthetic complex assembly protein